MLYVSRYIGSNDYGVVDTDDNTEERISYSELVSACEKLGICVAGVASHYFDLSSRRITIVDSIMAYQVPEMRSPLQVKTDVMLHVNVVTHKSMITNILWDGVGISTPPVIRLSDYGDCCGDRILSGNCLSEVHQITLILDNKVKFTPKTFRVFGNGVSSEKNPKKSKFLKQAASVLYMVITSPARNVTL